MTMFGPSVHGVAPLSPRGAHTASAHPHQVASPTKDPRHEDLNHVALGIWIGSHYVLKSAQPLLARGIRQVVNAAIEFITENPELINWEDLKRNNIDVYNTMWDDTLAFPIFPSPGMEVAVKKIDEVVRAGGNVLVNCAMGKSRSCSVVVAYLMARQGMTYDEALALCKRARPKVQPNANFERQLRQLEASLRSTVPAAIKTPATPTSPPMSPLASPTGVPPASPLFPPTPTSPTFNHAATVTPASLTNVNANVSAGGPASPYGYNRPPYAAGSAIAPPPVPQSPLRSTAAAPPVPSFGHPTSTQTPASPPSALAATHSRSNFGVNALGGAGGLGARGIGPKYGLNNNSSAASSPYGAGYGGRPGAVSPVHHHPAAHHYGSFSNLHNAARMHDNLGGLGSSASGHNSNMMMRRRSF